MSHSISEPVVVGQGPLGIDALIRISVHGAQIRLTEERACVGRMATCAAPGLEDDRPLDGDIEAVYQSVVAGPLGQRVEAGG